MRLTHKTLPLVLALLMGALLTVALVGFASVAGRSQRDEALLQQWTRAGTLAAHLDAQLASSVQAVHTLAELASAARTPQDVERLLERTFRSTSPRSVHGAGVYYAPFRMEPGRRYFGPYLYRPPSGPPALTYEWSTPAYDYPSQPWYQRAVALGGAPFLTEPYGAHDVYLSIIRAFFDEQGRVRGVASVDMTLAQLQQLVVDASEGSPDILYVATQGGALIAHPRARELLAWARARGRPARVLSDLRLEDLRRYEREHGLERTRHTTARALWQGGWTVYVSTDKATLFGDARRLWVAVLLCGGALWGGLLAAAFAARRSLRVHALARELEAQERAQRTLAASEQKLRQVLHTALDGVVATDDEGRIADGRLLALEELPLWRALRGEVVRDASIHVAPTRPGARPRIVRTSVAPIRDEAGQVVAAVALSRDVTQTVELERLKDEFLRVAAHELKTPVAVVKSYAQLALKTAQTLPAAQRRLLEGVGRGVDRLDHVIRTLLDASQVHLGALRFELREVDGEVEVRVRDEGVGIPVEQQARLFERFYRPHSGTPHDRGGMGLGLYLAREIARLHGGHLVLESQPGQGTTACVRLPSLPSAHPREEPPSTDAHPAPA